MLEAIVQQLKIFPMLLGILWLTSLGASAGARICKNDLKVLSPLARQLVQQKGYAPDVASRVAKTAPRVARQLLTLGKAQEYLRGSAIAPKTFRADHLDGRNVPAVEVENEQYAAEFATGSTHGADRDITDPSHAKRLLRKGHRFYGILIRYQAPASAFNSSQTVLNPSLVFNDLVFAKTVEVYDMQKLASGISANDARLVLSAEEFLKKFFTPPQRARLMRQDRRDMINYLKKQWGDDYIDEWKNMED